MSHITQEVNLLTGGRYSPRELKLHLCRKRRRKIPNSTWQRWKKYLNICPDENGNYWEEDKQKLEGLIAALKAGWTIDKYKQLLESKQNAVERIHEQPGAEPESESDPIEVIATACE